MAFTNNPHRLDGKIDLHYYTEADSQSFKAGQIVYLAAGAVGGQVTVVADAGTLGMGIAMADATNVTSDNATIPVDVLAPGDYIRIRCNTGAADTLSNTLYPGKSYGLVSVSNVTYLDSDNTTQDVFVFIEPEYSADGDATYWAIAQVKSTAAQGTTGS